jgi:MFS family permease
VRRATLGTAVACAAQFLIGADGLSVAIALPALRDGLGAETVDAQWVLTAYGLAFGGTLLLGGRLGDLYGRRRVLIAGMALFAAGALVAALAPSLGVVIVARALQGFGAAASVPAALALIGSLFPEGRARRRALALLAAMASVGILTGLVLGGTVTQLVGWRWVFGIMVVPALLAAAVAPLVLPEARAPASARPDVPGAVLVTGGAMLVVYGLTRAEHGSPALVVVPLAAGLAVLAAFVAWERRAPAPLLPPGVLATPSLRAATLGVGANAAAFTAIVYVGTLYLQDALGYGPLAASLALAPIDAVALVVTLALAERLSRPEVLPAAFAVSALALLWLARAPESADYVVDVLAPLVVLGVSVPIAFVALTHQAVADVDPDERGIASGLFETSQHLLGGAAAVALYATVVAAASYAAAFAAAAALALLGTVATRPPARRRSRARAGRS